MQFNEPLCNAQPQPCPAICGSVHLRTVEPLENMGQISGWYSRSSVVHRNGDLVGSLLHGYLNGIKVSKRTIQKYMRQARPHRSSGQTWSTFLHNHAHQVWACDFLPIVDLFFRQFYAFFIIELGSRRVVHVGVTDSPTDAWVAQQLREATPFGTGPCYLVRDNDSNYGRQFAAVAAGANIKLMKTPIAAPNANAVCERFLGSVRRECLDHCLLFGRRAIAQTVKEYVHYFNKQRPHQSIEQRIPQPPSGSGVSPQTKHVTRTAVLGGLHHSYQFAA